MPRDRLAELEKVLDKQPDVNENAVNDGSVVIQMSRLDDLSKFFEQADEIRTLTIEVADDIERVTRLQSQILTSPLQDEKARNELDQLMSRIKTSLKVVQRKLKAMEADIKKDESESNAEHPSAHLRMRKTQHSTLLKSFTDAMLAYQKACTEYKDKCKAKIHRQMDIAGRNVSEEEVEDMIEQGNSSVFTNSIIVETEQARQVLADVMARHEDIIKLEKSILELHDMFMDMAMLVESQGVVIDSIESNVTNTVDYVETAKQEIHKAQVYQTSARKKKICLALIALIVVAVIILVIVLSTLGYI